MDRIVFTPEQIAEIADQTLKHNQQWNDIWDGVRRNLSATAAEALSHTAGGSLDDRSSRYQAKTHEYNGQLQQQAKALHNVRDTSVSFNQQMTKTISG